MVFFYTERKSDMQDHEEIVFDPSRRGTAKPWNWKELLAKYKAGEESHQRWWSICEEESGITWH